MASTETKTTIFYDGSCPLCRAEVGLYRDQDRGVTLSLVDVSLEHTPLPSALSRKQALERFHVTTVDGRLLAGAAAFVEVWRHLPRWRTVAALMRLPGAMSSLDMAYRGFLLLRPALVRTFVAASKLKARG